MEVRCKGSTCFSKCSLITNCHVRVCLPMKPSRAYRFMFTHKGILDSNQTLEIPTEWCVLMFVCLHIVSVPQGLIFSMI